MSAAYRYKDERVGFCRSLWLVLNGACVNEAVTYLVTEDYDPERGSECPEGCPAWPDCYGPGSCAHIPWPEDESNV